MIYLYLSTGISASHRYRWLTATVEIQYDLKNLKPSIHPSHPILFSTYKSTKVRPLRRLDSLELVLNLDLNLGIMRHPLLYSVEMPRLSRKEL